jgi:aspartate/methionine/tyrosine aminotransferase
LRKLIARRYEDLYGIVTSESNILMTQGASSAFMLAVVSVTEPGDVILVPDPGYTLYAASLRILGRQAIRFRRDVKNGFRLADSLKEASTKSGAKAVVVNSPENPTGYVWPEDEMRSIVEFCEKRDMFVLHDEVYSDFVFDGQAHHPASASPGRPQEASNVILLNSFSKRFGMPSLRMGWLRGSAPLVAAASKAQDYLTMSVSPIAESIAELIMEDNDTWPWVREQRAALQSRRDAVWSFVASHPQAFHPSLKPSGAMFVFVDVSPIAERIGGSDQSAKQPGTVVSSFLDKEYRVATVPGVVYGAGCTAFIRIVISVEYDRLNEALDRFVALLSKLGFD